MNSLNNYQIKLLAAILMVIDHVGFVFFPDVVAFRVIGRFSFPLFIVLLVEGEKYTRNFGQYCLRLLLLGVLSQPLYELLFQFEVRQWNILFLLFVGLLGLRLVRVYPRWQVPIWSVGGAIAQFTGLEYGVYGVIAIALVHQFRASLLWWLSWIGLHLSLLVVFPSWGYAQLPAIAAPLLFLAANHQPGRKARWFYFFYPAHLLVLWWLREIWIA